MSGTRFEIDGFIPDPMPQELKDRLPEIRAGIRKLMAYCVKINEGKDSEENTIKAIYYSCYHDEVPTKPCGSVQEI